MTPKQYEAPACNCHLQYVIRACCQSLLCLSNVLTVPVITVLSVWCLGVVCLCVLDVWLLISVCLVYVCWLLCAVVVYWVVVRLIVHVRLARVILVVAHVIPLAVEHLLARTLFLFLYDDGYFVHTTPRTKKRNRTNLYIL